MNKRALRLIALLIAVLIVIPALPAFAAPVTALSSASVVVDGENVDFAAFNIGSSTYYKLRDIAITLNGTAAQFDVVFDGKTNTIQLTGGKAYTPVGGEMSGAAPGTAVPSGVKVLLDGAKITLTAYNIAGNNYFKLRDIAAALNFGVQYYKSTNAIHISSAADYQDVGYFDRDYDYSANPTYKVVFMNTFHYAMFEDISTHFYGWALQMDIDYQGSWSSNGDADAYISALETFIGEGYNGFILSADETLWPRVSEIMDEYGAAWMPFFNTPRDTSKDNGPLLHPCVDFDQYAFGTAMTDKLLELKDELWPEAPLEDCGFIALDFSISPPLHERASGAVDAWLEATELDENTFIADAATTSLDFDAAHQLVTVIIDMNPQFKHWLIAAQADVFASGAANAVDKLDLTDNTAIVAIYGEELRQQWDAGLQSAWRATLSLHNALYTEPVIGALYAFMSGQATPETLWPEWVNNSKGDKYATLQLPFSWIDYDNYQEYYAWAGVYAGFTTTPEYVWSWTEFPSRATPPSHYTG